MKRKKKRSKIHIHPTCFIYNYNGDHQHIGISEVFPRNALLLLFPSLSEVMVSFIHRYQYAASTHQATSPLSHQAYLGDKL